VYVSNETTNIDVFFDNLQVTHVRGPLVEETHYYPYGLFLAGISSKGGMFGGSENRRKFNSGSELQNKEFSDGSGLEWYATQFRMYDPELGKWNHLDPKPNFDFSLYSAFENNPIRYNDPLGDSLPPVVKGTYNWMTTVNNTGLALKGSGFGLNGQFQTEPQRGSTSTGIRDTKAGGINGAGKTRGLDVVRVDEPHGRVTTPHLNINPKATGLSSDPHIPITSSQFTTLKTAGQVLDGIDKIALPVAIVIDGIQLGSAIKTDIQNGTGGDNTIVTGSRVAGGWSGAWAGAQGGASIGAGIGSFFGPGPGTAIGGFFGGIIGGIGGAILGSDVGEKAGEKIVDAKNEKK
jgi:RHS repeat-associated protein